MLNELFGKFDQIAKVSPAVVFDGCICFYNDKELVLIESSHFEEQVKTTGHQLEFNLMFLTPSGERMHENKDPWRLLLLRVGVASLSAQTRQELCQNGPGHVRSHQVSCGSHLTPDCAVNCLS